MKRQLSKNEEDLRAQLASFAEEKDDFAIQMQEYKKSMHKIIVQAKSDHFE